AARPGRHGGVRFNNAARHPALHVPIALGHAGHRPAEQSSLELVARVCRRDFLQPERPVAVPEKRRNAMENYIGRDAVMGVVERVGKLGRTRAVAPVKQAIKRTIDLIDGTTFRARPAPSPEGEISSFYERYGYAIFRGVIEAANIDTLQAALDSEVIASP